jgi:hypothetical protein
LGFELRALWLLGKWSTTSDTASALFPLVYFPDRVSHFFLVVSLRTQRSSSIYLLCSWDYGFVPPCLTSHLSLFLWGYQGQPESPHKCPKNKFSTFGVRVSSYEFWKKS